MSLQPRHAPAPGHRFPLAEPRFTQLAALCWRKGARGREVLLVTSSTGRWILPKGWPMDGKTEGEAALIEAWEEGGVARGKVARRPLGAYVAIKRTAAGDDVCCLHKVFAIKVREAAATWPEQGRRDRLWATARDAAGLVDEDGLRDLLLAFADA